MSKQQHGDVFDTLMTTSVNKSVSQPLAPPIESIEKVDESTSKRKRTTTSRKKKETNDNLKRCTFWADQTQWEWIQNYAYTTRQSIMDTMYEIIEDFQSNHTDFEIESKPRRRNTSTRR